MAPSSIKKKGRENADEPEGSSSPPERGSSYIPPELLESAGFAVKFEVLMMTKVLRPRPLMVIVRPRVMSKKKVRPMSSAS
jgi:hypothetical protein